MSRVTIAVVLVRIKIIPGKGLEKSPFFTYNWHEVCKWVCPKRTYFYNISSAFQSPTHASTHRHHRSKHQSEGQTLSQSHTVTTGQQPVQSSHHSSSNKHKEHGDSGKHRANGLVHTEVGKTAN